MKKAAQTLAEKWQVDEGLRNMVEIAIRAEPCLACARYALPGQMPLEATVRDSRGNRVESFGRSLPDFEER
ncbi:MAG: hypothetical protein KAW95_02755 [Dehalococcoidia bacterium]|nr:hypothetical protein [Dehalococcoidia bacterium]